MLKTTPLCGGSFGGYLLKGLWEVGPVCLDLVKFWEKMITGLELCFRVILRGGECFHSIRKQILLRP